MNASAPIPESRPTDERANEPSMEDILASIRRIIADDQVLPLTPRPAPAPPKPGVGNTSARPARDDMPPARDRDRDSLSGGRGGDHAAMRPPAPGPAAAPIPRSDHGEESRSRLEPPMRRQDEPSRAAEVAGRRRPDATDPAALNANLAARLRSVIDRDHPRGEPARPNPPPSAPAPREIPFGAEPDPQSDPTGKLLSPSAQASIASSFQALAATTSSETIDATVREMLRPMLKEWLDDNLPSLVERLVRAEIERVARGGR